MTFEEAMAELNQTITRLEEGDLPLQEALELYERSQELITLCNEILDAAELKLEELGSSTVQG